METLIDQAHASVERARTPRSPVTRNARYGLRGVLVGEATHLGPSQDSCRVSEEIVNCLEFDLTRVDKSTQLADRNVVRRLLDQGDPPRSSTKWFATLGEQEEYTMLDASTRVRHRVMCRC